MARKKLHQPGSRSQASLKRHGKPSRAKIGPDDALALLEELPLGTPQWRKVVALVLGARNHLHAHRRKTVALKTQDERGAFYFRFFAELRAEPRYRSVDPRQLDETHVRQMVRRWVERRIGTATLHLYISYLRVWAKWIGKEGRVGPVSRYVGRRSTLAHRDQVARYDRSWSGSDIDIDARIAAATEMDPYVGAQLRLMYRFGLRAKEAMSVRPHATVVAAAQILERDRRHWPDVPLWITINKGSKGGRIRYVPLITPEQQHVIDHCKALVSPGAYVGRIENTLAQNRRRFYYVLERCGITKATLGVVSHGLRHERAHAVYEARTGSPAPVRGSRGDPEDDCDARCAVASVLGHARPQIASCYLGTSAARRPDHAAPESERPD